MYYNIQFFEQHIEIFWKKDCQVLIQFQNKYPTIYIDIFKMCLTSMSMQAGTVRYCTKQEQEIH
jgi:hypothetical protein